MALAHYKVVTHANRDISMYIEVESNKGNRYLFDGLSNEIYSLKPDFKITAGASRNSLGLPNIERFVIPDSQTESKLNNLAKTLIIELTEQCNLRCTYCVFDDAYSKERSHSSTKLDISLAKEKIYDLEEEKKYKKYTSENSLCVIIIFIAIMGIFILLQQANIIGIAMLVMLIICEIIAMVINIKSINKILKSNLLQKKN